MCPGNAVVDRWSSREGAGVSQPPPSSSNLTGRFTASGLLEIFSLARHANRHAAEGPAVADASSAKARTSSGPQTAESGVDFDASSDISAVSARSC